MENKNSKLKKERGLGVGLIFLMAGVSLTLLCVCFTGFVSAADEGKFIVTENGNKIKVPPVQPLPSPQPAPPSITPPPGEPKTSESGGAEKYSNGKDKVKTNTKTEYGGDGKPTKVTVNKTEYDKNGNKTKETITETEYGEDGKPKKVTENKTEVDKNGKKTKQTNTEIEYGADEKGKLTKNSGKQTIIYYCPDGEHPEEVWVWEYSKKENKWVLTEYKKYDCETGAEIDKWSIPESWKNHLFGYIPVFFFAVSLILFAAGYKTKNNLFYVLGAGSFLIAGGAYFLLQPEKAPEEVPEITAIQQEEPDLETLSPLNQIDLLLTSADKNKNSGDVAAEKLELLKALDISLKNNVTEKTGIIETKLSDTTRREATGHRSAGNYEEAVKSADESIKYNSGNLWSYVEGIIGSEESGKHGNAVDYLDKAAQAAETISVFPVDTETANEYKNYAVTLNNNGTSAAKTAETENISISDAITAVKTGAEYFREALTISETLDSAGVVTATPTKTIISNLGSADINLIVLAAQAGDSKTGEDAITETSKLMADNPEVFPDDTVVKFKVNAGTFKAVVNRDYDAGVTFGMEALKVTNKSAGAENLVGSCLAIRGGEKNVKAAQPYLKAAAGIDPANNVYKHNLEVVDGAIASGVYDKININFGVTAAETPKDLVTCCNPERCIKTTVEKCSGIGGAVMECIPEISPGVPLVVPAAPRNFTPLNVSRYPDWWRNLTAAVNESPVVRDNWTYSISANRTCMDFANNLTEYLRSRGFNATFTAYWWENDTNPGNGVPGHAVSDVYAPGGEKVFIEPQWAKSDADRMQPPTIPGGHYLANGTMVSGSSGLDADRDGSVEARNGQHSNTFAPTDDNVMIEQYSSRSAARAAGVSGA